MAREAIGADLTAALWGDAMHTYSVAEIRNGTGWRPLQRFVTLDDLTAQVGAILTDLRAGNGDPLGALCALCDLIGDES